MPGLTGIYVGPSDLCLAVGGAFPGDPAVADEFEAALVRISAAAEAAGVAAGIHTPAGPTPPAGSARASPSPRSRPTSSTSSGPRPTTWPPPARPRDRGHRAGHRRRPPPARGRRAAASRRPSCPRRPCSRHAANLPCSATAASAACGSAARRRAWPTSTCGSRGWRPGADGWTEPVRLSDDPTRSEQNPVLFPAPDGRLWLLPHGPARRRPGHLLRAGAGPRRPRRHLGPGPHPARDATGAASSSASPPSCCPRARGCCPPSPACACPARSGSATATPAACGSRPTRASPGREREVPGLDGLRPHEHRAADRRRVCRVLPEPVGGPRLPQRRPTTDSTGPRRSPPSCPTTTRRSRLRRCPATELALVLNESSRLDAVARRVSLYDEIDDDGISDTAPAEPETVSPEELAAVRGAFWGAPRAPLTLAVSDDDGADLAGAVGARGRRRLLPEQQLPRRREPRAELPVGLPGPRPARCTSPSPTTVAPSATSGSRPPPSTHAPRQPSRPPHESDRRRHGRQLRDRPGHRPPPARRRVAGRRAVPAAAGAGRAARARLARGRPRRHHGLARRRSSRRRPGRRRRARPRGRVPGVRPVGRPRPRGERAHARGARRGRRAARRVPPGRGWSTAAGSC